MKKAAVALCIALATGPACAADAPDTVKGSFKSKAVTLQAKSAIAYRGKSFLGTGDALIVAVTNARVYPDALAEYYDRRRVVEKRVKDDDTGVVYFEFRPDGSYRGLSYYFAQGNGCGFCSEACYFNAIDSHRHGGGQHAHILRDKCFGCGLCRRACGLGAISMVLR